MAQLQIERTTLPPPCINCKTLSPHSTGKCTMLAGIQKQLGQILGRKIPWNLVNVKTTFLAKQVPVHRLQESGYPGQVLLCVWPVLVLFLCMCVCCLLDLVDLWVEPYLYILSLRQKKHQCLCYLKNTSGMILKM